MANLQTDVPLANAPISDPKTGVITEAWLLFLIQLWRRTGGSGGDAPESITIDDVLALETVVPIVALSNQVSALAQEVDRLNALLARNRDDLGEMTMGASRG